MIEVRKASPLDAEAIKIISDEVLATESWSLAQYTADLSDPDKHYFVADIDDIVVGFIGYALIVDEAHIMNLAVKESQQGQGVGQSLVRALLDDAVSHNAVGATLEVGISNDRAKKLYLKTGFTSSGVRPHYYSGGEDAVILWNYFTD